MAVPAQGASEPGHTFSYSPASGAPKSTITFNGSGCESGRTANARLIDDGTGIIDGTGAASVTTGGAFSGQVTIDADTPSGAHTLSVSCTTATTGVVENVGSGPFTVTGGSAPRPTTSTVATTSTTRASTTTTTDSTTTTTAAAASTTTAVRATTTTSTTIRASTLDTLVTTTTAAVADTTTTTATPTATTEGALPPVPSIVRRLPSAPAKTKLNVLRGIAILAGALAATGLALVATRWFSRPDAS